MKAEGYLIEGTILIPKPEFKDFYDTLNWKYHKVTKEEELQNSTIGEKWMIKLNQKQDE